MALQEFDAVKQIFFIQNRHSEGFEEGEELESYIFIEPFATDA